MSRKIKLVSLAVVAVAAFSAVATASASAAPNWKIAGTALGTGKSETVTATETTEAFTLTVSGLGITLKCSKVEGSGSITGGAPGTDTLSSGLTFTGCVVSSAEAACQVKSKGGTVGSISTTALSTELKTVSSVAYDIYKPTSGSTFAEIVIEAKTGKSCSVSSTETAPYIVTGSAAGKVGAEAVELEGEFSEAISTAAGAELTFGLSGKGKKAILKGKNKQKLTGTKAGSAWGVTP